LYTHTNKDQQKGFRFNAGCGWSQEGLQKYDELFKMVMNDRLGKNWNIFNSELYKVYQQRRRKEDGNRGHSPKPFWAPEQKKRRLDELNDCEYPQGEDEDDDADGHCNDDDEIDDEENVDMVEV
jgi:hypothetical protein